MCNIDVIYQTTLQHNPIDTLSIKSTFKDQRVRECRGKKLKVKINNWQKILDLFAIGKFLCVFYEFH